MVNQERATVVRIRTGVEGLAIVCMLLVACPSMAQEEKKPNRPSEPPPRPARPADPFAPAADPFGGGADPFGGGKVDEKKAEARRKKEEESRKAKFSAIRRALIQEGRSGARRRVTSADDVLSLEGSLELLHEAHKSGDGEFDDSVFVVTNLARRMWQTKTGETTASLLNRLEQAYQERDKKVFCRLGRVDEQYERFFGEGWPLAWRSDREFCLDIATAIIESKGEMNPAVAWNKRIAADKANSELYRMCYFGLAKARVVKPQQFDFSMAQPILDKWRAATPEDLLWQARILDIYVAAGLPSKDKQRTKLRDRFLKNLQSSSLAAHELRSAEGLCSVLGRLYHEGDAESEARPMYSMILQKRDPLTFRAFADEVGLSDEQRRIAYFKKTISVNYKNASLMDTLKDLRSQVAFPLWLDHSLREDNTRVSLRMKGSWQSVLKAVLAPTRYEFSNIEGESFWIGNPMNRQRAVQLVKDGLAKIRDEGRRRALPLRNSTDLDFDKTPLIDVCEFLEDRHRIDIEQLGDRLDSPLTLDLTGVPLHIGLSLLARQVQCDWYVSEETILLGSKKEFESFRKRDVERVRRLERLGSARSVIADALDESTRLEFIETPLCDVCEYLEDKHGIEIQLAPGKIHQRPITADVRGATLAWALDFVLYRHGLDWESDGEVLYVGEEKAVKSFYKLTRTRAERRQKYPKDLAQKLQRKTKIEFIETPLTDIVDYLQKSTGVQIIIVTDDDPKFADVSITESTSLPLDAMLDLLALKNGFRWKLLNGSVHLGRK